MMIARTVLQQRRRPTANRFPLRPLAAALAFAFPALALADPVTHVVLNCSDTAVIPDCNGIDDGTLRHAYNCAQDGDTIDLTQLQCSKISLGAALTSGPVGLKLTGPGAANLTISAGNQSRVLVHNGRPGDSLGIEGLTIRNGSYENPYSYAEGGGCIFSSGNVTLTNSDVTSCYTSAASSIAIGGAIFAKGSVTLLGSTVTGSSATSGLTDKKYATARGGGVYADTVTLVASVVSANTAASPTENTYGGGVYAKHFSAKYSTVSGNNATSRAGVAALQSLTLTDSTISGNSASYLDGGAHLTVGTAYVYNSTIAFNSAGSAGSTGGISAGALHIYSSIVARNTSGGVGSDVGTVANGISGTNNLIEVSNVPVPPGTIMVDPRLGPLQDNGGPTPTHALLADSPAIDAGSNPLGLDLDQRLEQRTSLAAPDIGAFELDRIFGNGFEVVAIEITR